MVSRLDPYLSFRGEARAALVFYQQVFGGELTLSTYGEVGAVGPEGPAPEAVIHGMLETDAGFTVMAADSAPGEHRPDGSFVALGLSGDDGDELRVYWERLSESGTVTVPLERQMWGDEYGECRDRFGVTWLVTITGAAA